MAKLTITRELVAELVETQFPQWPDLALISVEPPGWDNVAYRLGETMSVRLPSSEESLLQVDKEQLWLPLLARHLKADSSSDYARGARVLVPRLWSIYGWIEGEIASANDVYDLEAFASDLAVFLRDLYNINATGGPSRRAQPPSWWTARPT